MLLSLIDVLIGLTVVYLVFSTAASTAVDFIEVWLRRRGQLLERGITEIFSKTLGEAQGSRSEATLTLVEALYASPYISSLYEGDYQRGGRLLPSAIPPTRFAGAVLALARERDDFRVAIERMLGVAGLSLDSGRAEVEHAIATYYGETMDRVTGWYRRHVQKILFALGLAFAVVLNADTLQILRVLSQDDTVRADIVRMAAGLEAPVPPAACSGAGRDSADCETVLAARLGQQLALAGTLGLPLGWDGEQGRLCSTCRDRVDRAVAVVTKLAGFLLTALATTLGAPFWFTLLQRLLALRNVLQRPKAEPVAAPVVEAGAESATATEPPAAPARRRRSAAGAARKRRPVPPA